jgi:glycerophosphoryl diester phosphodiesterase
VADDILLVIGHRGAPGYRPEHTLASYELAIRLGADFIEPDLVATSDGQLVARHENEISGTTDVVDHPEFGDRRTTKVVDGTSLTGWFTEDFTLAELRTLRAKERIPQLRPQNTHYDGRYPVPTLQEVIDLAKRMSTATGRDIGIYPETKHPTYFRNIGLALEPMLVRALNRNGLNRPGAKVFVQSFETANLRALNTQLRVPLVQLIGGSGAPYDCTVAGDPRSYADLITPAGLAEIAGYADAIGAGQEPHRAPGRRRIPAAADHPGGRCPSGRAAGAPLHLPQREHLPAGGLPLVTRRGGLRRRPRRVRAVLPTRRGRAVLRQRGHRGSRPSRDRCPRQLIRAAAASRTVGPVPAGGCCPGCATSSTWKKPSWNADR